MNMIEEDQVEDQEETIQEVQAEVEVETEAIKEIVQQQDMKEKKEKVLIVLLHMINPYKMIKNKRIQKI